MFAWLTKVITPFMSFLQQVPTVSVLKERNSILEIEKQELQAKIREHEQEKTAKTTELGSLQTELELVREENKALLNRLSDLCSEPDLEKNAVGIIAVIASENRVFHKHELANRLRTHPTDIDYCLNQLTEFDYLYSGRQAPGRAVYYFLTAKGIEYAVKHNLLARALG